MNTDYWTNLDYIPKHVAMICDGNGRWAKKRGLPRSAGHLAGVNTVKEMTIECKKAGVKYLSLYGFSTENWKRPIKEVNYLMQLFVKFLLEWRQEAMENNIRFLHIGDLNGLPEKLIEEINKTILLTKDNDGMVCNIALNYGARSEIIRAIKRINDASQEDNTIIQSLNVEKFNHYLDTQEQPDIDILIRTAGERRISNFLLWQIHNAYLWADKTFWPDFKVENLAVAFQDYNSYLMKQKV